MKAACLIKPHTITIQELPQPQPQKGEVRVRLQKAGICGSDVHLFLGHRLLPQPVVIGHEAIGIVDALGEDVTTLQKGDRVVIEPNIPCGNCRHCNNKRGNICSNKRVLGVTENGCFAEYICLPQAFCWKLPNTISNEDAVTIEPAAVAYHALHAVNLLPADAIAVVGLGAIGMLITQLAINLGYQVYTLDINEANLQQAETMGAVPLSVKNQTPAMLDAIAQTLLKNSITAVFECAGAADTATAALTIAPRGADVVLVGLSTKAASFIPLKIVREGIRILPSIIYNHPADFRETIALVAAGKFNPGKIISDVLPLRQIQDAMELAASSTKTKLVMEL